MGSRPFMSLSNCSSVLLLVLCAKLLVPLPGFFFSFPLPLCFAFSCHCLCRCLFKAELSVPVGHTWVTAASCNLGKPISVITASFCIPLGLKTTPGFIRPSCSASTISPCPLAAPGAISYLLIVVIPFFFLVFDAFENLEKFSVFSTKTTFGTDLGDEPRCQLDAAWGCLPLPSSSLSTSARAFG